MTNVTQILRGLLALDHLERRALANWLLVWVVLANVGFVVTYLVGSPTRVSEIFLFGFLGFVVRGRSLGIQAFAFAAGLAYSVVNFISSLFNLPPYEIVDSIRFLKDWRFFSSGEYIIFALYFSAVLAIAYLALRRPTNFSGRRSATFAFIVTGFVAIINVWIGHDTLGHFKRLPVESAPFSSAVENSSFLPATGTPPHHLMVVMVESLGQPIANAELRRLIFARYKDVSVRSRFDIRTGTTTFYGSTTAGEVRELCGRWGGYHDLVERKDYDCLPARMLDQGFETSAYHSFSGDFFDRRSWYPNIGFQNQFFRDELVAQGAETCGGVFPGACDRDVPKQLAERLKSADKPQFVYWLTVNSHLPVPYNSNLEADDCARLSAELATEFPMICRQVAIWDQIDQALVKEITAPDFPATDILIVGDHMPPYLYRKSRLQFAPDQVPWILLKWRGS